jgi:hypothetical protein
MCGAIQEVGEEVKRRGGIADAFLGLKPGGDFIGLWHN